MLSHFISEKGFVVFKTDTAYTESFLSSDGTNVISRGLLQISQSSSNQSAYKCGTKKPEDLHNPLFNLSCGVKIISYWTKDKSVLGSDTQNLGCGRYWSVCRKLKNGKIKESYQFIKSSLEKLEVCR